MISKDELRRDVDTPDTRRTKMMLRKRHKVLAVRACSMRPCSPGRFTYVTKGVNVYQDEAVCVQYCRNRTTTVTRLMMMNLHIHMRAYLPESDSFNNFST